MDVSTVHRNKSTPFDTNQTAKLNTTRINHTFRIMHANIVVALALGATAVSATALPALQVRDNGACDPTCNFPESMYCPGNGGALIQKADIVAAARNGDRSGEPYDTSAANVASGKCAVRAYSGIPLWNVSVFFFFFSYSPSSS